jgi:hypothetical protein
MSHGQPLQGVPIPKVMAEKLRPFVAGSTS